MHAIFWHAWPHILAQLVYIKDVEVSIETKGQASYDYDIFAHACWHANVKEHYFIACRDHTPAKHSSFRKIGLSMEIGTQTSHKMHTC